MRWYLWLAVVCAVNVGVAIWAWLCLPTRTERALEDDVDGPCRLCDGKGCVACDARRLPSRAGVNSMFEVRDR